MGARDAGGAVVAALRAVSDGDTAWLRAAGPAPAAAPGRVDARLLVLLRDHPLVRGCRTVNGPGAGPA